MDMQCLVIVPDLYLLVTCKVILGLLKTNFVAELPIGFL